MTLAGSIFFVGCNSAGAVSRVVYNIAADNKNGAANMFSLHFPEFSDGIWPLSSLFFVEKSELFPSITAMKVIK